MKRYFLSVILFTTTGVFGQDLAPAPPVRDDVPFRSIGRRDKPNEVTVILDDVAPALEKSREAEKALGETSPAIPSDDSEEPAEKPEKGVTVSVIEIEGGSGPVNPKEVELLFPYAPKPVSSPPTGWVFDSSTDAPSFKTEVEVSPGSKIALSIPPHVLIPAADGITTFSLNEPGFDPAAGYQQGGTVGTILATSVRDLERDEKDLGAAIDRLQQLLAALPSPPPNTPPAPAPSPIENSTPKK
jgi:hypothetical protein